jgi:arginine:pyruvate transaminase
MRYASRTRGTAGKESATWETHDIATEMLARGEDAILLTIGDTDFPTPPIIVEAAHQSLLRGRTHYSSSSGEKSLRETIARRQQEKTGRTVEADQVVVTQGAQNALMTAALCLLDVGDSVIVPEPLYSTYRGTIEIAGGELIEVGCPPETEFHLPLDRIAAAVTPRTKAIFLATPNNPTGAVYHRDELNALAKICCQNDLWLVSDEVYCDLVYEGEHVSPVTLPGMAERTVTIGSLSKSHAMAGWRLGWLVGPRQMAARAASIANCNSYGIPTFIQDAAVLALETFPAGVPALRQTYARRRERVGDALNLIPMLAARQPEGGMFIMVDVKGTGLSAGEFADTLVRETGVALLPADGFGSSAAYYLRMNLGVADEVLEEAVRRISAFTLRLRNARPSSDALLSHPAAAG